MSVDEEIQYDIHPEIKNILNHYIESDKIPNILFHGKSGTGKKHIVEYFIHRLYGTEINSNFIMYVNCSHGKGIKFIRDELKFFAKTNITGNNVKFKSIVLLNADNLTSDAQSALRRCIEVFSHNTRFFMIAENKNKLMVPILSRLCEIHVNYPTVHNKMVNLHKYKVQQMMKSTASINKSGGLKKEILNLVQKKENVTLLHLNEKCSIFFEKGYLANDIYTIMNASNMFQIPADKSFHILVQYANMRKEIRNEKMLMFMLLSSLFSAFHN